MRVGGQGAIVTGEGLEGGKQRLPQGQFLVSYMNYSFQKYKHILIVRGIVAICIVAQMQHCKYCRTNATLGTFLPIKCNTWYFFVEQVQHQPKMCCRSCATPLKPVAQVQYLAKKGIFDQVKHQHVAQVQLIRLLHLFDTLHMTVALVRHNFFYM